MKTSDIPFDVKMKAIRSYLCGFWVFDRWDGSLEARLDYDGFTQYVGDSVYINDIINDAYDHIQSDIIGMCDVHDRG